MKRFSLLLLLFATTLFACKRDHFISDKAYRDKVEARFKEQKELAKNRSGQLFGIIDKADTRREREALKFLFAYMPLSDLADYDGSFFLKNVQSSFAARDTFSWGKTIPEDVFRHFVLPIRVNNENMDSSRWVFFAELKDRIRNLSMADAALEVNHWCHEKVCYRGTDGRTSSPLSTVKTAYGRCGEESTFTVAALRSVSIPARQCYTPRWAHSDDNHAWVEVWIDGKWHYMGACEPEPALDIAWFTMPAKRAMLVNTTVFGDYTGPADILDKGALYTKINVLANYAPVKKIAARVMTAAGTPADSAAVEFQLYNYAELYPLFRTFTDRNGYASFTTGLGDLVIWSAQNGKYGFEKIDVRTMDTVAVVLDKDFSREYSVELDLVPPAEGAATGGVSDSVSTRNAERIAFEDKLRGAYEKTFIDSGMSARIANQQGLNTDTLRMFMEKSRGNWRTLVEFITGVPAESKPLVFPILGNISEKDLRDIDTAVLFDALRNSLKYSPMTSDLDIFNEYILSPRIDNEWLKPWKGYMQSRFDKDFVEKARKDPRIVREWVNAYIIINTTSNYGRAPLTPIGSYELKVADPHSRDLLYVSILRSFGIPSRLDPATKIPQYMQGGKWIDASFDKPAGSPGAKGDLVLYNNSANGKIPEYIVQYTVEENKDGFYRTLDYEGSPLVSTYPCTLNISPGPYLLLTGTRLPGGTVLANLDFFSLSGDKKAEETITLRKNLLPLPVYGKLDPSLIFPAPGPAGAIIAYIEPGKEPSRHFIADLLQKKDEFSAWKGIIILVLPGTAEKEGFSKQYRQQLPSNTVYTEIQSFVHETDFTKFMKAANGSLPLVAYITSAGDVNYLSEGYRIGLGDDLLNIIVKK